MFIVKNSIVKSIMLASNDICALCSLGLEYEWTLEAANRIFLLSFSDIWLCELYIG